MPTGYTCFIEDGKITTGKEFLLLCSRAFGVAIDIKDKPLTIPTPIKFEPSKYTWESLERAYFQLEKISEMTLEEIKNDLIKSHESTIETGVLLLESMKSQNKKYEKVKKEVESWIPPTEEHVGIKKFALDQIAKSTWSDDDVKECEKRTKEVLNISDKDVELHRDFLVSNALKDVEYHERKWKEEKERAAEKTKFMEDFVKSLENIEV